MSPTCSKRFFAGRNARSAALRTIFALPQHPQVDSSPVTAFVRAADRSSPNAFELGPKNTGSGKSMPPLGKVGPMGSRAPSRAGIFLYGSRGLLRKQARTGASRAAGGGRRRASTPAALFLISVSIFALPVFLTACGGGERQDKNEQKATWTVQVISASFPGRQHLAQTSELRIKVRTRERRAIPT